ncbi:hypothetical protein CEXT_168941 [Caerostris extrusa]|uniref:Uncharacterized protein n=1 Tax=Caerostris extrusa TaxID=172846 RepID=A0AAV4PL30_CAEEX|nr:hypothetical protein CEXT_168941 [Caerostris extrusa]
MTTVGASKLPKREGCPESIDVRPCTCYSSPATTLVCQNIDDSDILRSVFLNSERYTFKEVHIEYSTLQYLPYDMFEKMPVKSLHLKIQRLCNFLTSLQNFLKH